MVVAHPFPLAGHVRLEMRVRELTQSHDRAAEQMKALEQRTEGLDTRYAELKRVCDGTVSRIDRIGADVQLVAARDSRLQPSLTGRSSTPDEQSRGAGGDPSGPHALPVRAADSSRADDGRSGASPGSGRPGREQG